jgi:flagellar P-ring protein precursor FlgI
LSIVGNLDITSSRANKVTIDEKSGTIVAGKDIKVHPVVVTHGAITLSVDESLTTDGSPMTIAGVAGVLQQMGANANDVIAILQALKQSGALEAELEIVN